MVQKLLKDHNLESGHRNVGVKRYFSYWTCRNCKGKIGWNGEFELDLSKPDGVPEKVDGNLGEAKLGWKPETNLNDGIQTTVDWYVNNYDWAKYKKYNF